MKNEKRHTNSYEWRCVIEYEELTRVRECVYMCERARHKQTCNALKIETPYAHSYTHQFEWCKILIGENPS